MPEPTAPDPYRRVPKHPASEYRVDEETREDIGYRDDHDPANAQMIRDGAQQATNERGAQAALAQTPSARREAELIARRESGETLSQEEKQFLAQRRARRENRNT